MAVVAVGLVVVAVVFGWSIGTGELVLEVKPFLFPFSSPFPFSFLPSPFSQVQQLLMTQQWPSELQRGFGESPSISTKRRGTSSMAGSILGTLFKRRGGW